MIRLQRLLVDHPYRLGLLAAALVFPIALAGVEQFNLTQHDLPFVLWALAFCLPTVWVFRLPTWAFGCWLVPLAVQLAVTDSPLVCDAVLVLSLSVIAAQRPWRQTRWWALAATVLALGLAIDWTWNRDHSLLAFSQLASVVSVFLVLLGILSAGLLLGRLLRVQRRQAEMWQQTARALERDQQLNMQLAASEERSRIAADMHDIVAHSLAVIAVQTDAARLLLDRPDLDEMRHHKAALAVTAAHEASVTALQDIRQLVGSLTNAPDATHGPSPTMADLPELVARIDPSGSRVRLISNTNLSTLPLSQPAQTACHRIAQEALSNVLRHAGQDATTTLGVSLEGEELHMTITDDGLGCTDTQRMGHGLVNMEQRARSVGGSLTAGPLPGGGFEVSARIPLTSGGDR